MKRKYIRLQMDISLVGEKEAILKILSKMEKVISKKGIHVSRNVTERFWDDNDSDTIMKRM